MLFGILYVIFRCNHQTGQRKLAFFTPLQVCVLAGDFNLWNVVKTGRKERFYWTENECIQRIWRTLNRGLFPPPYSRTKKNQFHDNQKKFYFSHFHPYINLDGRFFSFSLSVRSVFMDRYYTQMSAASPPSQQHHLGLFIFAFFGAYVAWWIKNLSDTKRRKKNFTMNWQTPSEFLKHERKKIRSVPIEATRKIQIEAFNGAVM